MAAQPHRSCPPCVFLQTERWLARQQARLLAGDHSHVIFTLSHDLNPLWLANVPVLTTLLFQAVCDILDAGFRTVGMRMAAVPRRIEPPEVSIPQQIATTPLRSGSRCCRRRRARGPRTG